MNEEESNVNLVELQLFNQIMRWEYDNKNTHQFTDKEMQDRIKKLIQSKVSCDDSE